MALVIGHSPVKVMHHYIQDSSILTLSYPGSRIDQLWSKLEDIAIIVIILWSKLEDIAIIVIILWSKLEDIAIIVIILWSKLEDIAIIVIILWSKLEDIAIIVIILSPGCQQQFLVKMASDNRLSAAIFGPKWLVTTGCQQPLPYFY